MAECRLTERISIERYIGETQGDNGFQKKKWDDKYYRCWATRKDVSGKDYTAAKATNSENVVTFTVRYCNKIKPLLLPGAIKEFKVKHKGYIYDIEYVSDYKNNHTFVDIKCRILNEGTV